MTIGVVLFGLLAYALCGAATLGFVTRKCGAWGDAAPAIALLWPVVIGGTLAWFLIIRPVIPLIEGTYRIAAGRTFFPPDADE